MLHRPQRAFITIPLEYPDQRRPFIEVMETLRHRGLRARYTPVKNLHLTLAFLGDLSYSELLRAAELVTLFDSNFKPVKLELSGLTGFPKSNQVKVVAVKMGGKDANRLKKLVARLRRELRLQNLPFDEKPFLPHVTVARLRFGKNLNRYNHLQLTESVPLERLGLYTSRFVPQGVVYKEVVLPPLSEVERVELH